jgi:hypothetical protein
VALLAIKLIDYGLNDALIGVDVLSLEELHELSNVKGAGSVDVDHLEDFVRLKVWMACKFLAFQLDLKETKIKYSTEWVSIYYLQ